MRARILIGILLATMPGAGCSGANPSSGQTAYMRVQNAQFVSGGIDTTDHGELPVVQSVSTLNNDLFPGVSGKSISGSAGPGSTAILIGLLGDVGYWVTPVQDVDQNATGNFTFSCTASFSPLTPTADGGGLTLVVRATDRSGNIGPAVLQPMTMEALRPDGALVISLDWDTQADLDLHVVLPSIDGGVNEIWSRKPTGLTPGTPGATVDDGTAAGYLDFDSNSQCVIDGRRRENVIFPVAAPDGHYIVRVDTFSLCSEVTARWRVQVFTQGAISPQSCNPLDNPRIQTRASRMAKVPGCKRWSLITICRRKVTYAANAKTRSCCFRRRNGRTLSLAIFVGNFGRGCHRTLVVFPPAQVGSRGGG